MEPTFRGSFSGAQEGGSVGSVSIRAVLLSARRLRLPCRVRSAKLCSMNTFYGEKYIPFISPPMMMKSILSGVLITGSPRRCAYRNRQERGMALIKPRDPSHMIATTTLDF